MCFAFSKRSANIFKNSYKQTNCAEQTQRKQNAVQRPHIIDITTGYYLFERRDIAVFQPMIQF